MIPLLVGLLGAFVLCLLVLALAQVLGKFIR